MVLAVFGLSCSENDLTHLRHPYSRLDELKLTEMTPPEFDEYLERDIEHYAEENTASGRWTRDEALDLSRRAHMELLPNGMETSGHHFFKGEDRAGIEIGVVWMTIIPHKGWLEAFIYDIEVVQALRGKGLGTMLLRATEEKAKEFGATVVSLHVFCQNKRAFSLYRNAGYQIQSVNLSKPL